MLKPPFFRDDFIPVQTVFGNKQINSPKLIPGELFNQYVDHDTKQTFVEMTTGIIYYRYNVFAEFSPYGFEYLEKSLSLKNPNNGFTYTEFETECKYLHSLLLLNYKQAVKNDSLVGFQTTIDEYRHKLRNHYIKFGKVEYHDNVVQNFLLEKESLWSQS